MANKKKVELAEVVEDIQADATETAPDPDELVPFYLFRDNNKYKDDVFVAVNGEGCLIQRGKQVMIKRKFAEVLQRSMDQDNRTAELISGYADEFNGMQDILK